MASPAPQTVTADTVNQIAAPTAQHPAEDVLDNDNDELAVDTHTDADSAYGGTDSNFSETQSIASIYKGYMFQGRRYESVSDKKYYQPADEKQWEAFSACHMLFLILDSQRSIPLFRSPISPNAQNILDIGTGTGEWAIDVADKYPNITVRGVDLFAPPQPWTAPNCIYEVDDVSKEWTWNVKFDFIHIRQMLGSFSRPDWKALYARIYENLQPGGWIEQVEGDIGMYSDDGSLPADSMLAAKTKTIFLPLAEKAGRPLDTIDTMRASIEEAGFINVQQQDYKCPVGNWPRLQVYKDAGRVCKKQYTSGMEGWMMYFLTQYGEPTPWSPDEVQVLLATLRAELDSGWHIYQKARRVWAQKPFDKDTEAREEPTVKRFASASLSPKQSSKKTHVEGGEEAKEA